MLLKKIINKFLEGKPEILKTTAGENSKIVIFKIKNNKYTLRIKKYNKNRTHPKKEFEFLEKLKQKKTPTKIPIVIKTKNNKPYFYNKEYYSIFKYIEGKNKYLWNNSNFNQSEIRKIFSILAKFHNIFSKIRIKKFSKHKPNIFLSELYKFNDMFLKTKIKEMIKKLKIIKYNKLRIYPIHNDFHGANILWKNKKTNGLIDWEWSRLSTFEWEFCKSCSMICFNYSKEKVDYNNLLIALNEYNRYANKKLKNIKLLQLLIELSLLHHTHWALNEYKKKKDKKYMNLVIKSKEKLKIIEFNKLFIN